VRHPAQVPLGWWLTGTLVASLAAVPGPAAGQDVEPRFLAMAPVGLSGAGLGYIYSTGAVLLDKTIPVENLDGDIHTVTGVFARFFGLFGMMSRADVVVPYATGDWTGELAGADTSRSVTGFGDPVVRAAVFFVGAPALSGAEFAHYDPKTVAGLALRARVPLGQYDPSRLINLGSNRWMVSPRLGVAHRAGRFILELYSSVWLFTDNTDFLNGNTQSQNPIVALQAHVTYRFPSGIWLAASTRQSFGGATSLNGAEETVPETNNRVGVTLAVPVGHHALKFAATTGLSTSVGNDYNTFYALWQYAWGGGR
jgi:hypothetical protein